MIHYITVEPSEDADKNVGYKFPFNACEILSSENLAIIDKFFEEDEKENKKSSEAGDDNDNDFDNENQFKNKILIENQKLYKEVVDGIVVPIERHLHPILMSELQEATEKEIKEAKSYFKKKGKCKHHHLIYDKYGFIFYERYCGICGAFIDFI